MEVSCHGLLIWAYDAGFPCLRCRVLGWFNLYGDLCRVERVGWSEVLRTETAKQMKEDGFS